MFSTADSIRNLSERPAIEDAVDRIVREIREGLKHGFFELRIECNIVQNGRRELIVHAGKAYRYLIPREEALEPFGDPR